MMSNVHFNEIPKDSDPTDIGILRNSVRVQNQVFRMLKLFGARYVDMHIVSGTQAFVCRCCQVCSLVFACVAR